MNATSNYPTLYPDVNEILDLLLTSVKQILLNQFVGMYLFGSLANRDFDKDSDIDVLFVTQDEIAADLFSALHEMHARISEMDSPWAIQLEVSYISKNALRRFDPTNKLHPHIDRGNGEILHMKPHESDWVIQRHILRERGITLAGPIPQSLIDPVSPNDLRQAVVDVLPLWAEKIFNDPGQINSRGYQSFIVLTLCRMIYTLHYGTIISKPVAARWAQDTLDKKWKPLIKRAWHGRQNSGQEAKSQDIDETLKLMRYTLEYSKQIEDSTNGTENI
jgi:predicted nucleotidyltransferase